LMPHLHDCTYHSLCFAIGLGTPNPCKSLTDTQVRAGRDKSMMA
jgi:hypothetical protein